ncbi:MAG TPA: DUF4349 domain-containing protein [Syntrophomonadaceae bacterium]|jgi:hypothetical protein|nr:DUF4349 domain-containing protein [Syntrophomonadaceae bacterium]
MRGIIHTADRGRQTISIALLGLLLVLLVLAAGCGVRSASELSQSGRSPNEVLYDSAPAESPEPGSLGYASGIERKTSQNADLQMKVQDVSAAVEQIIALSNQQGGYTVNSHVYRDDERVSAQLVIKVPQANLQPVLESIASLGEVTDKVITTQDVTEEYYDSQARLKVLQAKEQRLLGLMDKAANITEIISVENELTKTRSEIEVLSGRLQYLSNITDFSQINIRLQQGIPGTVKAPQGTWGKAWQGFIGSINGVINFASQLLVSVFVILPWAAILAVLTAIAIFIGRRSKGKKSGD